MNKLRPPLDVSFSEHYRNSTDILFADLLVIATEGSTYQKAGSRMIVSRDGKQWGMIGGGCFDSVLRSAAVEVIDTLHPKIISVDTRNSEDLVFGSGLGCQGLVEIYIRPIAAQQTLDQLYDYLGLAYRDEQVVIQHTCEGRNFYERRRATPRLIIFGGGDDVPPIFRNLFYLGWSGIAVDPRQPSEYSRKEFSKYDVVFHQQHSSSFFGSYQPRENDACLIMSHRLDLDIETFCNAVDRGFFYLGILGPPVRRDLIYKEYRRRFNLEESSQLGDHIYAPCGLALGGGGPDAIALAVCAELQLLRCSGSASHLSRRVK